MSRRRHARQAREVDHVRRPIPRAGLLEQLLDAEPEVAIQQGAAAGGSQAPVVNRRVRASMLAMPHCGRWTGRTGRWRSRPGLRGAPGATAGALLDLDRAEVSLCLVVGEGHGEVDPQDHVLVVAEAPRECGGVAGEGPSAFLVVRMPAV